jgi:hypothetical protein
MQPAALVLFVTTFLAGAQASPTSALPDDVALKPVRDRLVAAVDRAAAAGVPRELVISKVREGLAKRIDAQRIERAVDRLADSLVVAQRHVAERRPGETPAPELVRVLAEAHLAGVDLAEADEVVRGEPAQAAHAIEVLTALAAGGYPAERSSLVVRDVLARDPGALARIPRALDLIRQDQALSQVESVDALSRGLASGGSLEVATARAIDDEGRRHGRPGRSPNRDSGDKIDFVPPGLAKRGGLPKPHASSAERD